MSYFLFSFSLLSCSVILDPATLFSFAHFECYISGSRVQICRTWTYIFKMKYFARGDFNVQELTLMFSGKGRHCIQWTDVGQKSDWWNLKRVVLPLKTMLQDVSLLCLSLLCLNILYYFYHFTKLFWDVQKVLQSFLSEDKAFTQWSNSLPPLHHDEPSSENLRTTSLDLLSFRSRW